MKKITFSLLLFLAMVSGTFAQVQVGYGTNEGQSVPFEPYFGYTYAQSIYHSNEINATGSITSIQWYYSGTSLLTNNQMLVIYMGHTDKAAFDSNIDFVSVDNMTQVYTGGIPVTGPGWITLTLTTPFVYNGVDNLVIAVDENMPNYNASTDDFHNTAVTDARSIYSYSDSVNTDPLTPDLGATSRGIANFVPSIIFGGITQSCPNVTGMLASNVTTSTANLSWQAGGAQTAWQILVVEAGTAAPTATDAGLPVTGTPTYAATNLLDSTNYVFYVRTDCGGGLFSGWSSGYAFKTQCPAVGDFEENFDSTDVVVGSIPACWSRIQNTSSPFAYTKVESFGSSSPANNVALYNSEDANAQLFLITPTLTALPANTHRIKFKAIGATGYNLLVGTMSDPTNPSTFTLVQTIALSGTYADYNVTFNASTTNGYVAFKHGLGGTYRTIRIDNFVWEPVPALPPACVSDAVATINDNCGNFATAIAWTAVDGADGYRISIGTTAGGTDVVNNVNLNNTTSYSFVGNPGTAYFYTVTSYNAAGSATACTGDTFTTVVDGCYCTSVPTSNDNSGITAVQIGASEFTVTDVTYYDFSATETIDITQGITNNASVSFATGYTYHTYIYIDLNNNYTFEPAEQFFTGESSATNPTVYNTSFVLPATAALGNHRMRIVTYDYNATPLVGNPCYSGAYGITLDFTVNVLPVPACLPPSAGSATGTTANSTTLNWVSTGTLFNIEHAEAGTPQGSGTLVSGLTGNSYLLGSLDPQTDYQFYVQTNCGAGSLSPWAGPFTFRTACLAFDDFTEEFTTDITKPAPECWYTLKVTADQFANVIVYNYNDYVQLYNSNDAAAQLYLITPSLTSLPAGTHRIKFNAFSYSTGASIIVGTMSDPTQASTFVPVQTIPVTSTSTQYNVSFNTVSTSQYVAFKFVGTGTYQYMYVDNVIWEPAPTVAPVCVTDANVATNSDCGNFANVFTWSAIEGADFYNVTVGTTPGQGTTVNVGNALTYSFTGNFNTTYYYKVVPGNAFGSATGCVEGTFTTATNGCYCPSLPTSNDNSGITGFTIGDSSFTNGDVTYFDFSGEEDIALTQGELANVEINFATGYTYNTYIFIDMNNNFTFEASEQVFAGESLATNPTTYNASFTLPATAPLGVHRMRIVTYDYNATPAVGNPCYSGSYGVSADFNVNIDTAMATGDFNSDSFRAYPNPVTNVLNISYAQNITNVAVFNILGQEVITNNVNATQGQIDMSDLAVGTYLVKVTAGDQTKTIKVLRK